MRMTKRELNMRLRKQKILSNEFIIPTKRLLIISTNVGEGKLSNRLEAKILLKAVDRILKISQSERKQDTDDTPKKPLKNFFSLRPNRNSNSCKKLTKLSTNNSVMKYSKYSKHPANCLSPLNAPDISRDNSKSKFKPANENVAMSSFSSKSVSLEGSIHLKNAVHDQNEINIESHFQSEIQSICDDNLSESRERILEGLKAVENGNQKYLNQNPSHESDRVIDFLEDNFNRDLQIESSRLKDNLAVDLSYDKHKQLKLSHRNGTKDRKLLDLIQKFKLENTELVNKISSNPVENTKKKKTILLLLNELRHQIAKNCKERGDVLTKLWKSYFREISGDQNRQIQHKNE